MPSVTAEREGYDADLFARMAELEERSFWFRSRNRLLVEIAAQLTRPGDSLLEVGCGTGYVLRALVRSCGLRGTGSELHAEGLEHARRRVPEARLVELDAREMPFSEEFDLVGAFDVIEHIDDDVGVLRGLYHALRPGGSMLVTVPQHPWLWSQADVDAHHVRRYQRERLLDAIDEAGFTPVRITSFVTTLLPLMALSRLRDRSGQRRRDTLKDLVPPAPVNKTFELLLSIERALLLRGVDLPLGGSLLAVARRL